MYRDTTNVEPEMYDYTNNNWSHWNINKKLKEKFGSCTRKIFDRFITKDIYTWNITHNMESTAVSIGDTLPHTVVGVCGEFQRTGRFLQRGI